MSKKHKQTKEKSAMSLSLYGNLFFVILEMAMAVYTGSQAVLLDAIYDGIEFFMLLPSIFFIPLLYKPSTEKHPYGYMQVETVFLVIKGFTMLSVSIGLIFSNIQMLIHGGHDIPYSIVAYFELFAMVVGILVALSLKRKNRLLKSPLINAEIRDWGIDSIISAGMTLAFFLPLIIPFGWFDVVVPYLDPTITLILSTIMLPIPIKTVITSFRDLLLIPPEDEIVQDIKLIIKPYISACNCLDYHCNIVRTGRKLWISTYLFFDKETISIKKLKIINNSCVQALKTHYSNFSFKLIPDYKATKPIPKEN